MHAFKVLVVFENGDHEVLHYVDEEAADGAFESLKGFAAVKLRFAKLYRPSERYHPPMRSSYEYGNS